MAIRIPILTSFDPKGLKQANAQFAKLQTSMSSLGRNFAVAGIAITAAFAAIGRSVADAAESQKVFAQTEAVLKSMGTTANGTATDLANMASALQKTTAFSDEAILAGANLLLTFKNIQNQAGAGNDIFDQTATLMLDVARAMGTSASGEAIRLGKALNDPVKGISALTRVGIQFTDQQKAQIKALAESGDLMGAQKIILAELQQQFGGSAAAYAGTFAGQVESLNNDLNDLSEEIGFMVMPAIKGMVTEFRNLIPVIGAQLKAAIESVDWKALTQSVIDITRFLSQNGATIAKVVVAIFALNTAYKLMAVASGIASVALQVKTWWLAKTATGMTSAAIATGVFSTALKAIPFVAIAAAIGSVVAGITEADSSYRRTTPVVTSFGQAVLKTGQDAQWAADKYGVASTAAKNLANTLANIKPGRISVLDDYAYQLGMGGGKSGGKNTIPTPTLSGGGKPKSLTLSQQLKREGTIATKEARLISKGLSEGLASKITGSATPIKSANKILTRIAKNGQKAVNNLQKQFNKTKAGRAEIANLNAQAAAAAEQAAAESAMIAEQQAADQQSIADQLARSQQEAADREAAILAEKERVYNSFLDSVKNTFANIKDSIMGAFDLGQLGGSTNAITRNMEKLLTRLRSFATNVKNLSEK